MVGRAQDNANRIWDAKVVANVLVPPSQEKKGKKVVEAPILDPPNRDTTTSSTKDRTASSKKDEAVSRTKGKPTSNKKDKASSR